MRYPTPKHRNILHLQADMKSGAGSHKVAQRPGPSAEEWDFETDERDLLPASDYFEKLDTSKWK